MTPYLLVVTKSRDDVFGALFFEGLAADLRERIRILEFGNDSLAGALAGSVAVIVMRHGLFSFGHLAACAGWAGVPRYYFIDDNLMLLSEEPEVYGPYWSAYTDENVRRALKGFAGVLLASRPLMRYFEEHALHSNLIEYPPIAWPVLCSRDAGWDRGPGQPFRIAFFGGEHRRDVFAGFVYPAVQRLAREQKVELVLAGIDSDALPTPASQLRIVHFPYELRYGAALAELVRHRIDVLVHPMPPSRNNPYKNANVLINARAVGAVPVLSNLPPYNSLGSPPPALLCENDPESWYGALARLSRDSWLCEQVFEGANGYCEKHFSGRRNAEAVRRILTAHATPGRLMRAARRVVAGPPLGLDRVKVRAERIARGSRVLRRAVGYVRHRTAAAAKAGYSETTNSVW